MDHIPSRFRLELRELCGGVVLRVIDACFQEAGFTADEVTPIRYYIGGDRKTRVQRYYNAIDWRDGKQARQFLKVVSAFLGHPYLGDEQKKHLREMCKDAGFVVEGNTVLLTSQIGVDFLLGADASFDRENFARYCGRMLEGVNSDPSQAIGAAKELVEAVCKYVLQEAGEPADGDENLQKLTRNALTKLDLTVEQLPEVKKGAEAMKKVLGSFASTVQGMAELRNLYGTGHGRTSTPKGLKPRHAKLAVGAAITFSTFVLETMEERKQKAGEGAQDQ